MRIDRRRILIALTAVSGLAVGGVGGIWWRYLYAPAAAGYLALSDEEIEVVDAFAEAWMPPGGTPAISGREARLAPAFDEVISRMDGQSRAGLKALLQVLDDATWPTQGGAFHTLPLDSRIAALEGWLNSDVTLVRNAVLVLISLMGDAYMLHPEVVTALRPMFRCGYGP